MNLFTLGFKSDKNLENYLNGGTIEEKVQETEQQIDGPRQNSKTNNLTANYAKDSLGIRDSNLEEITPETNNKNLEKKEETAKEEEQNEIETLEREKSLVLDDKRSLFNKIFGPLEAGSIRGSIFNMVILSLGTGMLALPKYVGNTSILFACIFIIVIAILVWWSLLLLSKACEKNQIYNYSKLLKQLYGKPISIIYDIIVILYSFGVLILYNVIIQTTLGEAVFGLHYYDKYDTADKFIKESFWSEWYIKYLVPYLSTIIIVYPMCLIKDVSKLRIISLIGVVNILFLIFIVLFQSKDYITKENLENYVNYYDVRKGFQGKFDAINFISTIFFASCFHIGCVPVINTLKNNVRRRIYKAIRRTILMDLVLYLAMAVVGYLSCPENTPSLIIQRETKPPGEPDILMSIGKLGLVFTFFTKLPNTYSSLRITLFDKLFGTTEITNKKNYIVTFVVMMVCVTVSILYSNISNYIKIMGGIFSTLVGFLFPSLLIVRANSRPRYHWKNILTVTIFSFLTLIGFIASGLTVYEMIHEKK